jgi:hypothetical protein
MRSVQVTRQLNRYSSGTARRPHYSLAIISVTVQLWIQVFWVDMRNILPKSGTFLLRHPVYRYSLNVSLNRTVVSGYGRMP